MQVTARPEEDVQKLLRRFKRKVDAAGILKEVRKREFFLKPSIAKRKKRMAAEKRRRRSAARAKSR